MSARAPLTPAFLREHRWAYAGLVVVVGAASAVATASIGLLAAAGDGDGLVLAHDAPRAAAEARVALESVQYVTGVIAGVGLFFTVFLVGSAVGFAVEGRRRELAMLRLAGATPGRVTRLVLGESAAVSVVAGAGGAVLGLAGLAPYAALLVRLDLAPPGFAPSPRPAVAIVCAAGVALVAIVGAFAPARRVGRVRPIEALAQNEAVRTRLGRGRVVRGALGTALAVALLVLPPSVGEVQAVTLLLAAASVVALSAFAPVVIPAVARVVGVVAVRLAPGAGLVAREHASWDVRRTAALGNPVLLITALASALFMVAQTGQAVGLLSWEDQFRADVMASTVRTIEADGDGDRLDLGGRAMALRYETSDEWAWPEGLPGLPTVAWTEPTAVASVVDAAVLGGQLSDVRGDAVATTDSSAHVGDTVEILAPDGSLRSLTVAAVVESTAFMQDDVIAADDSLRLAGDVVTSQWFVTGSSDTDLAAVLADVRRSLPDAHVSTVREWIDSRIQAGREAQTQGLSALIGGAGVLALCSVAQSVGTSIRERRSELRLLQLVGAPRRPVVGTAVVEVVVVLATSAALAAVAAAAMYGRLVSYLRHEQVGLAPSLPVGVLGFVLVAAVTVATVSAAAGAWAATSSRAR
jgi:putative ABC transport system permease protein